VAKHKRYPKRHAALGDWVDYQRKAYGVWQARLNGEIEKYKNITEAAADLDDIC